MPTRTVLLTILTMIAFSANSVLCRKALAQNAIDPASFTLLRVAAGAVTLFALAKSRQGGAIGGSWRAAAALLAYAVCFSFAYISLSAGTGALLLFGAVQATMIIRGLIAGERPVPLQWLGLVAAMAGLVALMAPGVTAPDPVGALLMLTAGAAWGGYSLLGRLSKDAPIGATAGNFLRAAALAAIPGSAALVLGPSHWNAVGISCALLSGAVASGAGYALWYTVLPRLKATTAASVQLSVPVITVLGGTILLGEPLTLRLCLSSIAVLGGIALVIGRRRAN